MATEMSRLLDALDRNYQALCDYVDRSRKNERSSRSWLDSIIDGN